MIGEKIHPTFDRADVSVTVGKIPDRIRENSEIKAARLQTPMPAKGGESPKERHECGRVSERENWRAIQEVLPSKKCVSADFKNLASLACDFHPISEERDEEDWNRDLGQLERQSRPMDPGPSAEHWEKDQRDCQEIESQSGGFFSFEPFLFYFHGQVHWQ